MWFTRFANKEGITDTELLETVSHLEAEQADADLGGGVYKMRMARPGGKKSGGYRVIVFFKSGERTFYQYGFAKSNRDNIDQKELRLYKKMAKTKLALSEKDLADAINAGELIEI
jgi:hypothetical protein